MKRFIRYKNIDHTLKMLIFQATEGLPFMRSFIPENVFYLDELFDFLKQHTTFVDDPPETELIQSPETLFRNNYHGIPGAGDCDCFTTAALSACVILCIPCKIVLCGRVKSHPVHIYLEAWDDRENKFVPFDLTQSSYMSERDYPYKYSYPVKVQNVKPVGYYSMRKKKNFLK